MSEAIKQVKCTIDDFTEAKTIQALLTIILTVVLALLVVNNQVVPEWFKLAWFTLLGVYMELPKRDAKHENLQSK